MFSDLYNEDEGIDKRIERFVFHCDRLREEIYAFDKSMKNHFHDGQRIVSLYLAFRFPEKYAIYKFTEFKTFMEIVRAREIPSTGEYERFFKVVRTLYNILIKDTELMRLHKSLLTEDHYKGETLMLAQDFIFITARRYMK
jgi:5-methylcytosine-specific restriction protein B